MGFNEAQIKAINHAQGPALVLAGPGSGKTTVITMRTKNLIEKYKVNPSEILVVTFTKMAANEMKQRFLRLIGESSTRVTFGTFHAVFFTILRNAYNYSSSNIIHEEKQRELIKQCIGKFNIQVEDETQWVSDVLSEISMVKSEQLALENYYSINASDEVFRDIFKIYENALHRDNLIDFDDMMVYCYELLSQRKDILEAWQKHFRYIAVDEFQDINQLQYKIVRLLAGESANLFIVGDDDQSIYGFRGAKPEIMLNFVKDYPNATQILLNYNYRSNDAIIQASVRVIAHNKRRFAKDIKGTGRIGLPVNVKVFDELDGENQYILNEIIRLHNKENVPYNQIALLARTNVGVRPVMGKLIEYNIPFTTREKIPNLYDHWIAQDIFSYVRLGMGGGDRGDFLRIMNKPKRYISRDMLVSQQISFSQLLAMTGERFWLYDKIKKFEQDIHYLRGLNPYAAINYIRRGIGYDDYLREYAKDRRMDADELLSLIGEIQENAREFNTYPEWFAFIDKYTEELNEQAKRRTEVKDAVSLCTMHAAKGLEFEAVFVADCNEGVTPYHKSVLPAEIEEERRLFYVAMTRAKSKLYLCSAKQRFNKNCQQSRFVKEMQIE